LSLFHRHSVNYSFIVGSLSDSFHSSVTTYSDEGRAATSCRQATGSEMRPFRSQASSSYGRTGGVDNRRDPMGLLATQVSSQPSSPAVGHQGRDGNASLDKPNYRPTPEKVQFVPAYDESLSRSLDTTQSLSSPEPSFSLDHERGSFRNISSHLRHSSPMAVRSSSPGHSRVISQPQSLSNPRNLESTSGVQQRQGSNGMARFASLFSSRATVKTMEDQPCPSPPRSDSSSGYVGWPGTQDKRGATVAIEQASYSDSEVGGPRSKGDSSLGEYNLVEAVVNATAAANSPLIKPQSEVEKIHQLISPMDTDVSDVKEIYGSDSKYDGHLTDPWADVRKDNEDSTSEVSTGFSKTSSAYFTTTEVKQSMKNIEDRQQRLLRLLRFGTKPQPPTVEALRINDHLTPPHRAFGSAIGYRGLLDKTQDVPNLMDGTESETTQSSVSDTNYSYSSNVNSGFRFRPRRIPMDPDQILEEASDVFDGVVRGSGDADSDVFDNLSRNEYMQRTPSIPENAPYTLGATPRDDNESLNLVLLGGGLTTIQTTANHFSNRRTASDFDENLTNSDYDQYGYAKIPGFNEMATAGKKLSDRAVDAVATRLFTHSFARPQNDVRRYSSPPNADGSEVTGSSVFSDAYEVDSWGGCDLQQYYIHPDEMKPLVKKFRKMSLKKSSIQNHEEMEREEDATKAFALMEMRSRIMEKDIERGLERRGGTSIVDDLVLTAHNRAAMRVRDATIVAKAWRDGATPKDVVTTALLTQRPERRYFILRPIQVGGGSSNGWDTRSPYMQHRWEEVTWLDDLGISLYRCHSIGPRHLRGFEMFTIGDCQSILLKLCNQQCVVSTGSLLCHLDSGSFDINNFSIDFDLPFQSLQELRAELNEATAMQLEAEDELKAEEAYGESEEMMTETEMRYLTSMEEVKTISRKLVLAEKAFTLVRDRIEKLVRKYEALLVKLDNDAESVAASSVITDASSYYSDYTAGTFQEERELEVLARRARRAELRAELAAREAMLTKQRAMEFQKEKEKEIKELRQKLNDLQSESSAAIAEREHSVIVARAIAASRLGPAPSTSQAGSVSKLSSLSKVEEVKQRFRSRSASRKTVSTTRPTPASSRGFKSASTVRSKYQDQSNRDRNAMFRAVGEEMFQHLDFYERSLKSVESSY